MFSPGDVVIKKRYKDIEYKIVRKVKEFQDNVYLLDVDGNGKRWFSETSLILVKKGEKDEN